jgi:hypothetical protein
MIRTPVIDEAKKAGYYFEDELNVVIDKRNAPWTYYIVTGPSVAVEFFTGLLLGLIPLAISDWLSGFKASKSTSLERGFTTSRLLVSILFGPTKRILHFVMVEAPTNECLRIFASYIIIFGVPAIGGMVVVGQMMGEFGTCTLLG